MGLNNSGKRQVCAVLMEAKNLAKVEPLENGLAGATTQIGADIKSRLLEFALHLKREGDTEATILTYGSLLKKLLKLGADLLDPDTIKDVLAEHDLNQNTKASIVAAYTCFLKFLGLSWVPPKCRYQQKIPFIPLESEIDDLIAGCSKTISAILQLLKETGMRIGEANSLEWTDIDLQRKTVVVNTPEKHGNPRILKISTKLIAMVQALPKKCEKIFGKSNKRDKQSALKRQRDRLAEKLGNPRLRRITFHTLRHWKATMEYHNTHDPWHVKKILGHKSLRSTELYINIEQAVFDEVNDCFHVKVVQTLEEACKLLEVGFEYVTDMDGQKLFRKRK